MDGGTPVLKKSLDVMPVWLRWLQWISFFRYGYEAFMINEFQCVAGLGWIGRDADLWSINNLQG